MTAGVGVHSTWGTGKEVSAGKRIHKIDEMYNLEHFK